MQSHAEALNNSFGPIFATHVDEFGLPIDGWAVPVWQVTEDLSNRRFAVTVGTYRIEDTTPADLSRKTVRFEYESMTPSTKDIESTPGGIEPYKHELLHNLVKRLKDIG